MHTALSVSFREKGKHIHTPGTNDYFPSLLHELTHREKEFVLQIMVNVSGGFEEVLKTSSFLQIILTKSCKSCVCQTQSSSDCKFAQHLFFQLINIHVTNGTLFQWRETREEKRRQHKSRVRTVISPSPWEFSFNRSNAARILFYFFVTSMLHVTRIWLLFHSTKKFSPEIIWFSTGAFARQSVKKKGREEKKSRFLCLVFFYRTLEFSRLPSTHPSQLSARARCAVNRALIRVWDVPPSVTEMVLRQCSVLCVIVKKGSFFCLSYLSPGFLKPKEEKRKKEGRRAWNQGPETWSHLFLQVTLLRSTERVKVEHTLRGDREEEPDSKQTIIPSDTSLRLSFFFSCLLTVNDMRVQFSRHTPNPWQMECRKLSLSFLMM